MICEGKIIRLLREKKFVVSFGLGDAFFHSVDWYKGFFSDMKTHKLQNGFIFSGIMHCRQNKMSVSCQNFILNCGILTAEASKHQISSLVVLSWRLTTWHKVSTQEQNFWTSPNLCSTQSAMQHCNLILGGRGLDCESSS